MPKPTPDSHAESHCTIYSERDALDRRQPPSTDARIHAHLDGISAYADFVRIGEPLIERDRHSEARTVSAKAEANAAT